ncbi:MAG: PAS domain S-box protein [Methanoregulaceae archaeon]|jgi:PAS domain S-box-containing protein|nr:PAS domain S-box protein [Methanoregulaceae archaeon]MCC7467732.1 PAS domain S-box protein [Burkholderiaceae bacterium]NLH26248.1 PAS domain S-box protein [Methanomicrobiales archaeon]HPA08443.1 PAS domain S-box protein [Methanoregulaceae archaeon]HQN89449.1 PAS domain S-box protein [Methanoregulaceae archaeon]
MKRETKSIALFDDGSRASNAFRLHFQGSPGFSVTRVYSREELEHRMRKTGFDIIISPADSPVHAGAGDPECPRIWLFWSAHAPQRNSPGPRKLSFRFEIETPETSLSYHSSPDESLGEQFDSLKRLLIRIDAYHREFSRFQADTEILQSIVEDTVTGILYLLRNTIQWTNREAQRILGMSEGELAGRAFSSLFADDRAYREGLTLLSRNRESGGWGKSRCSLVRKSGEPVECTLRMRRLNPMNPQKGHLVVIEDDHDRRYLEWAVSTYQEKMAKNEMKYLDILQRMDQVIIRTDPDGVITFWNNRAETTFGYTAEEVSGKTIISVTTDNGSRSAKDMTVLLHDPGSERENALHILENRRKNAEHLWAAWSALTCRDLSGTLAGIVWIGQDISGGDPSIPPVPGTGHWKSRILQGTDVLEEVFDLVFHAAIQLGRGGREAKKIGTSFVIGDAATVMVHSRQSSINAFEGKDRSQRMIQDRGVIENIKNLALLDGAFVIDGSGFIHASSRHLLADITDIEIPEGFGTRHASVAAMTAITRSIGIVVSESGGTVTVFREGRLEKQIEP